MGECVVASEGILVGINFLGTSNVFPSDSHHDIYTTGPFVSQQFHRVLKPGGVAVMTVWEEDPTSIMVTIFRVLLALQGEFFHVPGAPLPRHVRIR